MIDLENYPSQNYPKNSPPLIHKYKWILFDADETLFSFDAFSGLQLMFSRYDIQFTADDFKDYQLINKALWLEYQNNAISPEQLQWQRFEAWGKKLEIPAAELNRAFLNAMADICKPLTGAASLIHTLKGKAKLGIITNGFTALQEARLQRTGLREHFEILVISENVGFPKPHKNIFDHALTMMGNPDRKAVLMVGDNLDTDILGGINAGLDTCWLNTNQKTLNENIKPNFHVSSLAELELILVGIGDSSQPIATI